MTYDNVLAYPPFSLEKAKKAELITSGLKELTQHHRRYCSEYDRMMRAIRFFEDDVISMDQIPFLPVRLFKEFDLRSIDDDAIFKVMTSSGTSGQQVSKIYLDRENAANQQKTLLQIVKTFTGAARIPMIIIDCPDVLKNRAMFSARGAGILGFSIFGSKRIYALDNDMQLQFEELEHFIAAHKDEKILVFGFTFMIWQHFYQVLKEQNKHLNLENAILIHGGGWKKLIQESVSPAAFNHALHDVCNVSRVCNYYGMVEQTGCIYMECECGHLHTSTYSDVLIRRGDDFSLAAFGEKGIIQVLSLLPKSYPGHSLLTEDEGILHGEDDCPCGRKGKYFSVLGRLENAEIRGCSDTYAQKF